MSPEASNQSAPPDLSGAQRRHLRGLAHPLKPVVFVGEAGISDSVMLALDQALASHELVKVRLRQPANKKQTAKLLADGSAAALCGVIGHTVVLYRPDSDSPKIKFPA